MDQQTSLRDVVPVTEYQAENAHVFPSKPSVDWFIRQHKKELVNGGAIVKIAKRWMVHPHLFATVSLTIGKRNAQGGA